MAFTVNLFEFQKKNNSTIRPAGDGTVFQCVIKEPCGILKPTIGLNLGLSESPTDYNYAYIAEFKRYYYIREWTFQNALWYASLDCDALASWKTQIGASTCYVLRSSLAYDGTILDRTYPATNVTSLQETQGVTQWVTDDIQNGMFVVGVAGQSTTYYLFTYNALQTFFEYLFSDVYAGDLTADWSTIYPQLKAQTNPLQYITSIMWFPFITTGTSVDTIRVGWVDVPVAAAWKVTGSGLRYNQVEYTIARHPQASRGAYLNNAPFTTYNLFFPPWGLIPLDPDTMANSDTISVIWGVDLRTGQGTLTIAGGELHTMSWLHSQVGLHYQVSQVVNRGYGIGNTFIPALSTAANLLTGNVAGAIATPLSEIGNFANSKIPSATTIGSNGGLDSLRGTPALQYEFKHIVDEDLSHRGRPLCENRQINTLSGFIMVSDADISISATKEEQDTIRANMEGGFFYE